MKHQRSHIRWTPRVKPLDKGPFANIEPLTIWMRSAIYLKETKNYLKGWSLIQRQKSLWRHQQWFCSANRLAWMHKWTHSALDLLYRKCNWRHFFCVAFNSNHNQFSNGDDRKFGKVNINHTLILKPDNTWKLCRHWHKKGPPSYTGVENLRAEQAASTYRVHNGPIDYVQAKIKQIRVQLQDDSM